MKTLKGAITVEFAVLAPILLFVFAASLETSRVQLASMLLDRSVYDMAYQSKVAQEKNFPEIAAAVLEARHNRMFDPQAVAISVVSSSSLANAVGGESGGAGGPSDIVHLKLQAELGIFKNLVPDPFKVKRTIDYYYINEPGLD
jgi:hypothetical protein